MGLRSDSAAQTSLFPRYVDLAVGTRRDDGSARSSAAPHVRSGKVLREVTSLLPGPIRVPAPVPVDRPSRHREQLGWARAPQ